MDWIVITGVPPWDGRYQFDVADEEPTTREWGWIKRLTGYLPVNIDEGLRGADPELFTVFAAIALRRAGKITQAEVPDIYERLIDAPAGVTIRLESDQPVDDEVVDSPPPEGNGGNGTSSGPGSPTSSEISPPTLPVSGIPASATSVSRPTAWES
jgi:hypothetical protein